MSTTPPQKDLSGEALALEIATAMQHLARQQLDMESRLGDVAGRQEVMAQYLKGFIQKTEGRLHNLEIHLNMGATISEGLSAEIALAVKNVGQRLVSQRTQSSTYNRLYKVEPQVREITSSEGRSKRARRVHGSPGDSALPSRISIDMQREPP